MHVTIIGTGYVGLTTAVALAYVGHQVTAVDKDIEKLRLLQGGKCPIHEPGLDALLAEVAPRIRFTAHLQEGVPHADVVYFAVGTPQKADGEADVHFVFDAAREVAGEICAGQTCTLVVKSTVPIGTNRQVSALVQQAIAARGIQAQVSFASNPEFLREGVALRDTLYADRIVVGSDQPEAIETLGRLYRPMLEQTFLAPGAFPRPDGDCCPHFITTDLTSAEMIKYAANAFLPLKISFINEIAGLCEKVGADVTEVARGIGVDPRIGARFLNAGLGWGGSCFPKDTAALIAVAGKHQYTMPLIEAARAVNVRQRQLVVDKMRALLGSLAGRVIGVLGLAFKANTDDVRDSPAIELIRLCCAQGATVLAHDPVATANARRELTGCAVTFVDDPYDAARQADALVLATEWDRYHTLDLPRIAQLLRQPILMDARNFYQPEAARAAGLTYMGVGRMNCELVTDEVSP